MDWYRFGGVPSALFEHLKSDLRVGRIRINVTDAECIRRRTELIKFRSMRPHDPKVVRQGVGGVRTSTPIFIFAAM